MDATRKGMTPAPPAPDAVTIRDKMSPLSCPMRGGGFPDCADLANISLRTGDVVDGGAAGDASCGLGDAGESFGRVDGDMLLST
mmetsp:Transcript_6439/g.14044  ORF Transcript_6439/g.14044 Transcript_6439/m.14044 type:complete len:84 (+) Transcript_6439:415-666(+)